MPPPLPLPEDSRGHSWPDAVVAAVRHPALALLVAGAALVFSASCKYHFPLLPSFTGTAVAQETPKP
jgi:hypothetical protein